QLNAIYTQRGIVGIMAIALVAFGYAMFIKVIHTEVRQRSRLEAEVNIAKGIQESLLPDAVLQKSWITVVGSMTPAAEVGGDVYDVIPISDDLVAVAIADVSGHGVGAGILSAMTKSALHLQLQHDTSPVAVLEHLNRTLFEVSDEKTFVTFGYMLIDHAHKTIALATAGHPPVLQYDSAVNKINFYRTANIGLGMRQDASFTHLELPFRSGDTFVLYTDGAVETADPNGEQFGIERIQDIVATHHGSVQDLCSVMNERLKEFTAAKTFQDDVTIVCVHLL
ncbi:MAG TPA: PP2C family protein-serine/threonine phosphatase, partial [Bacteroidota bacterium]|nr:PP2C family protein-serine/threonine phosphatase [Bacteroidota bacterium]